MLASGHDVVVKVSVEAGEFGSEAAAVEKLAGAGLPVSRVRLVEDGPPSVIVLDWTPGRAVRADDPPAVRRQVADLLARVHAMPAGPPYAGVVPDLVSWIDGWCRTALEQWSRRGGDAATAEAWYREVRPLIAGRRGSQILLDGVPDHFLVGPDDRVRLIDVANLQPGDPVMDVAVLVMHAPELFAGVFDAYHQDEVTSRHLTELLPFYVFLRALAAAEWHAAVVHDDAAAEEWLRRAAGYPPNRGLFTIAL